ncbi:hypothetical protein APR04_001904 [Promicromonospora umidemergens]|uniref:ATP/GTP-binding protein n=1 Tax=Promicromonospora umidemergens TaxID=629679 RepID=A0ABP8XDP5_9MICO|nr:hypothetical protein [Promicromonospora umidemergens]MCP2283001.1 hypothetical protein [Promicromonospora umidemergens]
MRRTVTALTAAILIFFTGAPAANAVFGTASTPTADPGQGSGVGADGRSGNIITTIETVGKPGGATPVSKPDGGRKPVCTYQGDKIPCTSDDGAWDGGCYVKALDPEPPKASAIWQGNEDGLIVTCTPPCEQDADPMGNSTCAVAITQWVPSLPGAPDPAVLAQRAVDQMQLQPIEIGIVPEDEPGSVGIVGMPQWMWVNEPGPTTFGPMTASASAGGHTVTATANVDKTVWDMGDGNTVTCVGPGTPYEDRYDIADSPDCGHRYTKQGEYEVTAMSYWTVEWEGIGQSGTIPVNLTNSTNIVMGEAQVITQ